MSSLFLFHRIVAGRRRHPISSTSLLLLLLLLFRPRYPKCSRATTRICPALSVDGCSAYLFHTLYSWSYILLRVVIIVIIMITRRNGRARIAYTMRILSLLCRYTRYYYRAPATFSAQIDAGKRSAGLGVVRRRTGPQPSENVRKIIFTENRPNSH